MMPPRSKKPYARHDVRKYVTTRNAKWVDHRGEKVDRLLCLEWVGRWKKRGWWRLQCDCGRVVIRQWKPGAVKSCGCLMKEARKHHQWPTTLREDGTWRHGLAKTITLPDGRGFPSIQALARYVGVGRDTMCKRIRNWPPERWTEIPHPRGVGAEKHRAGWIRSKRHPRLRAQPWAADNIRGKNRWKRDEGSA